MTLKQATSHSFAQLKLLYKAADRDAARRGLDDCQVFSASIAAAWSKEGGQYLKEVQKALSERA